MNEVALCYSSLTTNDLSQSHNFIFVVWPKKPSFPKRASSVYGTILLLIHSFKKYLVSTYYLPGSIPDVRIITEDKLTNIPDL